MVVNAIYHGSKQVSRIYHAGAIIFQRSLVEFHVIEDDKLIILGALSAISTEDGVYLDCTEDVNWTDPQLSDGVLTISQAYTSSQTGTTLEVQ